MVKHANRDKKSHPCEINFPFMMELNKNKVQDAFASGFICIQQHNI